MNILELFLVAPPFVLPAPSAAPATEIWQEPDRGVIWQEGARMPTWTAIVNGAIVTIPLVKRSAEVRLYVMDLSALPEIAGGDTVASVSSITCTEAVGQGTATSDLTLTSKALFGTTGGQCEIAGGVDGGQYQITFKVVTTAGYTLVGIGYLYVDDR